MDVRKYSPGVRGNGQPSRSRSDSRRSDTLEHEPRSGEPPPPAADEPPGALGTEALAKAPTAPFPAPPPAAITAEPPHPSLLEQAESTGPESRGEPAESEAKVEHIMSKFPHSRPRRPLSRAKPRSRPDAAGSPTKDRRSSKGTRAGTPVARDETAAKRAPLSVGAATEELRSTLERRVNEILEGAEAKAAEIETRALEKASQIERETQRQAREVLATSIGCIHQMLQAIDSLKRKTAELIGSLRSEMEKLALELEAAKTTSWSFSAGEMTESTADGERPRVVRNETPAPAPRGLRAPKALHLPVSGSPRNVPSEE